MMRRMADQLGLMNGPAVQVQNGQKPKASSLQDIGDRRLMGIALMVVYLAASDQRSFRRRGSGFHECRQASELVGALSDRVFSSATRKPLATLAASLFAQKCT